MALSPIELFSFGGVSSRDNPLAMPPGRALRCKNFAPKDDGELQLRYGYSTVTMTGSTSTTSFHSLIPYTLFDSGGNETPYLLMGQGASLRAMNINTGVVTSPTVRGAAIAASARWASYNSNGKTHLGNGTDQKWFDGTTIRDNGLRSLTAAEVANVVVTFGLGGPSAAENAAVTLTAVAGGTFTATSGSGLSFYFSFFDVTLNELSPSPTACGSGRVSVAVNQKVSFAGLPNYSGINVNIVKLISRTGDGLANAYFCTNTSTTVTSCTRSGTTLTVIATAHGLSTGDIVILSGTTNFDSVYSITVTGANTFTATLFQAIGQSVIGANTTGGTVKRIVSVANAATAVDVTSPAQDTSLLTNDAARGVSASVSGIANAGFQFYASLYNPTADGHVSNRIAIGARITYTIRPYLVRFTGLPDLSGTDSELTVLIGRTGDGAQIPYPSTDSAGNYFYVASGQTAITLTNQGALNGNAEMPTRNGVIPSGLNLFARGTDRIHGAQIGRPYCYRSGSETDSLNGDFVGRPEQSWAANDVETFPTAKGLRGMFTEERGIYYGTKDDGAVLGDAGTGLAWMGPWYAAGIAGARSWCDTPYGQFWVTGHKQLATFKNGIPGPVSDEYEAALLSKIGDAYLSQVEAAHIKDVSKRIDHILIKALDSNGVPFEVIHDFRLRDAVSPNGQGYEYSYSAPLSTDFVLASVRDSSGAQRLWAGASTGQLYQLHTGANDAGSEYSADAVHLLSAGAVRMTVPAVRWYGDQNVTVSIGRNLDGSLSTTSANALELLVTEAVANADHDFYYQARLNTTEIKQQAYIRFQLDSHSIDGNLDLNDPPHVPLENYGRIYLVQGLTGQRRSI